MSMKPDKKKLPPNRQVKNGAGGHLFIRKGSGLTCSNGNLRMENLTHGTNAKELEATVITAEPGASCEETEIYFGEKWFYILEGKLEMLVNDALYLLGEGDSIYLDSAAAHRWRNPHKGKTRALIFSSPYSLPV